MVLSKILNNNNITFVLSSLPVLAKFLITKAMQLSRPHLHVCSFAYARVDLSEYLDRYKIVTRLGEMFALCE